MVCAGVRLRRRRGGGGGHKDGFDRKARYTLEAQHYTRRRRIGPVATISARRCLLVLRSRVFCGIVWQVAEAGEIEVRVLQIAKTLRREDFLVSARAVEANFD